MKQLIMLSILALAPLALAQDATTTYGVLLRNVDVLTQAECPDDWIEDAACYTSTNARPAVQAAIERAIRQSNAEWLLPWERTDTMYRRGFQWQGTGHAVAVLPFTERIMYVTLFAAD